MYFCWLEERKVQLSSPDGSFEICMIVAAVCGKNELKCVEEEEACLLCYCLLVAVELNEERNVVELLDSCGVELPDVLSLKFTRSSRKYFLSMLSTT